MGQQILRALLIGLILISIIDLSFKTFGIQAPENPEAIRNQAQLNQNVVSSRMTYGRFLEYLEMGWVKQVDLYDNSRNAIVQASSPELGNRPQTIRVEIPVGASQLIQKLKEYNIDFDAHPAEQKNLFVTIVSNLLLPLIFIIFLSFWISIFLILILAFPILMTFIICLSFLILLITFLILNKSSFGSKGFGK